MLKIGEIIGDFEVIRHYKDERNKPHTIAKCIRCGAEKDVIYFCSRRTKQTCKVCNKDARKKYKNLIIDNKIYANVQELADETGICKLIIEKYLRKNDIVGLTNLIVERRIKTITPIEGEIWKDIPNYEGKYQVSNKGRVVRLTDTHGNYRPLLVGYDWKSVKNQKYEKSAVYRMVKLPKLPTDIKGYAGGRSYRIHRLVAELFIPNPNNYPEVNHINGDGRDNRVENLEWCTSHDNAIHSRRILKRGFSFQTGEKNGHSQLTWEQVKEIRQMYAENPQMDYPDIARVFGVSKGMIGDIIRNKRWIDSTYVPPTTSHYFRKYNISEKRKGIYTKIIPPTLSKEIVAQIREEYSKNNISQIQLAKKYGISRTLVSDIVNYKRGYAKL